MSEDPNVEKVKPGEILVDQEGNVVIGAPTAHASASAPPPNSGQEEGDE